MLGFLSCFHCWINDVCVCIPPSTRTQDILQTVEKKKCTVMHAVPSMLTALSESDFLDQYDISSWRVSVVGGAAVAQGQAERLRQTFPGVDFLSGYGMSEVGFISSPTLVSSPEKRLVTVGKPPSDIRIRILAEEGKETTAGEIECAVAYPCYGYLSQGKAIALSQSRIRTGDIGLFDEEGNLVLTGRKKDVIVRGGEKIAPREIASVFSRMPGIKEAFVFGVPDDFWGEISVACLVPSGEESVTLEKVTAFAQGRLARYKIPDKIFFLKELPLLANGKIDRVRLYNDVAEHIAQSGIFINASERRKGNV